MTPCHEFVNFRFVYPTLIISFRGKISQNIIDMLRLALTYSHVVGVLQSLRCIYFQSAGANELEFILLSLVQT